MRARRLATRLMTVSTGAAAAVALGASSVGAAPPTDPERDLERSGTTTGVVSPVPTDLADVPDAGAATRRSGAVSAETMSSRLTTLSTPLLPGYSGTVIDTRTGQTIWSRQATTRLRPASNMKLVTATTALRTFGTRHRFVTPVYRAGSKGDYVYLRGVGDPTLSSYRLDQMARSAAWRLKTSEVRTVRLRVDDTLFPAPTNAPGWEAEDVPQWVAPVRALVVDQANVEDTSMDAARVFRQRLERWGIRVVDTRRARTAGGATKIAEGRSPELRTIVADMLRVSQNDYAEGLLWASGMTVGAPRTWAGVTAHARTQIGGYGVPTSGLTFADGSGLSRANRLDARSLGALVLALHEHPVLGPIVFGDDGMPIAGRTGTLENRFQTAPSTCAIGKVRAKTGSLRDTSALSGVARGTDGVDRVFVNLSNGTANTSTLRDRIDALAATATGCR